MNSNAQAMVLASFAADSLALGAHWIYDTQVIDAQIGLVDHLLQPLPDSYHKNRNKGEFTHYGDQALVLLESLAEQGKFSLTDFAARWQALFTKSYAGYVDKATTVTLENMNQQVPPDRSGSHSSDLGGAARIAPLVYFYRTDKEGMLASVRQQTAMTHNNPAVLAGAEFIALTAWQVLQGDSPVSAMEQALDAGVNDIDLDIRIRSGLESSGKDSRAVIGHFGQVCGIAAALPGAIHLIANYSDDLRSALIANVMAGGDSAARGLCVGMVLGASLGMASIPTEWLTGIVQYTHIVECLAFGQRL